jgi:hypothetical protein
MTYQEMFREECTLRERAEEQIVTLSSVAARLLEDKKRYQVEANDALDKAEQRLVDVIADRASWRRVSEGYAATTAEQSVEIATLKAQVNEWKNALDALHVVNWIGTIDGLSPREAVAKLLEQALDIERDKLKAQVTALRAYAAHRPTCDSHQSVLILSRLHRKPCTCGLVALLTEPQP